MSIYTYMYTMLRVIYTNLDTLVALVTTRGREILFIAISDIVVFIKKVVN